MVNVLLVLLLILLLLYTYHSTRTVVRNRWNGRDFHWYTLRTGPSKQNDVSAKLLPTFGISSSVLANAKYDISKVTPRRLVIQRTLPVMLQFAGTPGHERPPLTDDNFLATLVDRINQALGGDRHVFLALGSETGLPIDKRLHDHYNLELVRKRTLPLVPIHFVRGQHMDCAESFDGRRPWGDDDILGHANNMRVCIDQDNAETLDREDLARVIIHELGHVLGMPHAPDNRNSIMCTSTEALDIFPDRFTSYDAAIFSTLYPETGQTTHSQSNTNDP